MSQQVKGDDGTSSGFVPLDNQSYGVWGDSGTHILDAFGVIGTCKGLYMGHSAGVWGYSEKARGVRGTSKSGPGVEGISESDIGVLGLGGYTGGRFIGSSTGVQGQADNGRGVEGRSVTDLGVAGF